MAEKTLRLTVVAPARAALDTSAASVVAPAFDGEMGVLPGHAAMLALLGTGELRVTAQDGAIKRLAIRGGFLQVKDNTVTVLTPEAAAPEELKSESLDAELVKLDASKPTKPEERETLDQAKAWVRAKQRVITVHHSS
jgi:F-type H+-transporting ATPase subunit epsilon